MGKLHQDDVRWRFFVYELLNKDGSVAYVGKGSGVRLRAQQSRMNLNGLEVARFKREKDAYAFEVARITETKPTLNKCAGGNGNVVTPKRKQRDPKWLTVMNRIGTRRYAARLLLGYDLRPFDIPASEVEQIRAVAYG
jgi:hypothetical protein